MRLLFLALLITSMIGCSFGGQDRQAIRAVAAKRQQALCNRDVASYLTLLSPNYFDKGQDYTAKKAELSASLAAFDKIDYRMDDVSIEVRGDDATVTDDYRFRVIVRGKPLELSGKESLRLRKESDGWKIVAGL